MRSKWLWAVLALVAILGITTAASATTRGLITGKMIGQHQINSKHLVNHTIQRHDLSEKLVNSLRGARGPRGWMGETGPRGPVGPQGPKGSSDATVRRINTWLPAEQTVSAPVISVGGQLGTLSLTCGAVTYTTNLADVAQQRDVVTYYSPNLPSTPTLVALPGNPDHVTIPWSNPQSANWIEMMIEGYVGGQMSVTTVHGFMQQFPLYDNGCIIYFTMDAADVSAPTTTTPTG